jgi:hypothetical protein
MRRRYKNYELAHKYGSEVIHPQAVDELDIPTALTEPRASASGGVCVYIFR